MQASEHAHANVLPSWPAAGLPMVPRTDAAFPFCTATDMRAAEVTCKCKALW